MDNPEITSDKILSIISDQWLTNADIVIKLGLKQSLDKKYLNIKLEGLERKEKIVWDYDDWYNQIYWKKNNSEELEELKISFYLTILEEDPFDAETWHDLGSQYLEWNWILGGSIDADFYKIDIFTQVKEYYKNALMFVDSEIEFKLHHDILLDLAMTYIMLEKPDKAQSQLDILLKIKEELEEEFNGRVYLEFAQVYLIRDEYNEALDYVLKANEKLPNNYDVKIVLGQIKDSIIRDQELVILDQELAIMNQDSVVKDQDFIIMDEEINPPEQQELDDTNPKSYDYLHLILREMKRLSESSEKRNLILMKSYVDQSIKPFLENPSNKKLKKLKGVVNNYKEGWPDDMWELFVKEFHLRLELYKELQPSKWEKWGKVLVKLILII